MVSSYLAVAQSLWVCLVFRLWVSRLFSLLLSQSLKSSIILRRSSKVPACLSSRHAWDHSILLFCGTVLVLTDTWVSQANLLFGLPGLSSHSIFVRQEQSSKLTWHKRYGLCALCLLIAATFALRTPMPSPSFTKSKALSSLGSGAQLPVDFFHILS